MGVYVFSVLGTEWIKVGHHRVTPSRPNVYYRVARRGFYSCVHPKGLLLDVGDLELLRWYPTLGTQDERLAHRSCLAACGEFHPRSDLPRVLACLDARGAAEPVTDDDRDQALAWAASRAPPRPGARPRPRSARAPTRRRASRS